MEPSAYGAKMMGYVSAGCAAIGVALAKEVGIIDVLLASNVALTSQEIADNASLKERYVRELLGALVSADVILVDANSTKFHVPEPLKPVLKSTSTFCRMIPLYGQRCPAVRRCIPLEGPNGVPFSAVPEVFSIMDQCRSEGQDSHVEEEILDVVPGLKEKLEKGISVAEFGSASGIILCNLAARFPASTFTGSDIESEVVTKARKIARDKNLTNIEFEVYDINDIPEKLHNKFDWIYVSDVVHDLAYPDVALAAIGRCLKADGVFSMLDLCLFGTVADNAGYLKACWHYTGGALLCLADSCQHENSAQLGPSWTDETARDYLRKAGFKVVKMSQHKLDKHMVHFVCKIEEHLTFQ